MKNTIKFLGIIVLALVIGFSMTACSDGGGSDPAPTPPAWADFIGKWHESTFNVTTEITANKLKVTWNDSGNSYELINLTATPVTNTNTSYNVNYPTGFKFTGTVANKNGTLSSVPANGQPYDNTKYIHTDKGSIAGSPTEFAFKQ